MALEQETNAILRTLAERTIEERDSCQLDSLMQADIPQGIKSFFRAETRRKLEGDLGRSSWITGIRQSDAGAARVAQALLVSLTEAYRFTRQEFLDTLDIAVHFSANYLCRPQWTLENFLFDRSPQISLDALSEGLSYVADYRYLGELAIRLLQRRHQREISREEFRALIGKIDEEVVRQHSASELASLTRPIFEFFQVPGTHPGGAIPVEALLVFFEDKKLRILKEYVRGICHLRNRPHVTFDELAQLTEDLFAGKSAAPTTQAAPSVEPVPTGEPQKVNIALSLTFAGLQGTVATLPQLPEIKSLIRPDQRDRFVTHVFKGDAAHYAGALVMIDSLKTWRNAETFLTELFRTNNLDSHTGEAMEFSNTIRRRYVTNEKEPE